MRARLALLAVGMLAAAPAPAAAQTYRLSYSEDCSRADSALVQESCDGKRETRLRERLRQIGMLPAARPQDAAYHLVLAVTIGYSGWYEEEVRSGKRVRDLTQTRVVIAVKRNDATLAERTVDLDSQQCGTDADEAPAYFALVALAAAGVRPAEVARLIADEMLPLGACGTDGTEMLLETLRSVRGSIVPALRPLLADRRRSSGAAHLLGSMGSGEGAAALRMQVETLSRTNTVVSLEAAVSLASEFAQALRWVPADKVEPRLRVETRELLRILSAPPYPAQKRRFYAAGAFYDSLLEDLRELLEPKTEAR